METIEKLVGERVRELRLRHNLSQSTLARNAKTSLTTINRLEKGRQFPHPSTLADIARALKVTVAELYQFTPPAEPEPEKSDTIVEIIRLLPSLNQEQLGDILDDIRSIPNIAAVLGRFRDAEVPHQRLQTKKSKG